MITNTFIVLTDYEALVEAYSEPSTRIRWGVECNPVLLGVKRVLPIGWEKELDALGIPYVIENVTYTEEEI